MFITVSRRAQPVTALQRFSVDPVELSPCRADFNQSLKFRMVPVEVAAPPADVRDKQVLVRLARVSGIQLIQRPRPRFDGAGGKLVPLERAGDAANLLI